MIRHQPEENSLISKALVMTLPRVSGEFPVNPSLAPVKPCRKRSYIEEYCDVSPPIMPIRQRSVAPGEADYQPYVRSFLEMPEKLGSPPVKPNRQPSIGLQEAAPMMLSRKKSVDLLEGSLSHRRYIRRRPSSSSRGQLNMLTLSPVMPRRRSLALSRDNSRCEKMGHLSLTAL